MREKCIYHPCCAWYVAGHGRRYAGLGWLVGLYDINPDQLARAKSDSVSARSHNDYCNVTDRDAIAGGCTTY